MDLSKAIAELEKEAALYTEAANQLRALQTGAASGSGNAVPAPVARAKRGRPAGVASKKAPKASGTTAGTAKRATRRTMSPETRAKIAAATKARHAARKAAA